MEKKAVAEVQLKLMGVLDRPVRKGVGKIEFSFAESKSEVVSGLLTTLTLVEYVFVSLVSCPLVTRGAPSSLDEIRELASAVSHQRLHMAVSMWQRFSQRGEQGNLTFRTIGKRGGKHDYTSDDIKRAVASGLVKHPTITLQGTMSKKDYDFQICGHLHHSQFWVGLAVNAKPLSDIAVAAGNTWVDPAKDSKDPDDSKEACTKKRSHDGDAGGVVGRGNTIASAAARGSGNDGTSNGTTKGISNGISNTDATERSHGQMDKTTQEVPAHVDLLHWSEARLKLLGYKNGTPRSVHDVVTPLWEMPYDEQLQRKKNEMEQIVKRIVRRVRTSWVKDEQKDKSKEERREERKEKKGRTEERKERRELIGERL
jgi:hypothetical protein